MNIKRESEVERLAREARLHFQRVQRVCLIVGVFFAVTTAVVGVGGFIAFAIVVMK